jgi:sulfur relay protein TusB/DsrH
MSRYLLIESRDPFESSDCEHYAELAQGIAERGNETVLFLVQNGVLAAKNGSKCNAQITNLLKNKVKILVDRFSLKERAVNQLVDGVEAVDLGAVVGSFMEQKTKVMWH